MGRTVLQFLQEKGVFVEAACGGGGTCGKCLLNIDGVPKLACQTLYSDEMKIDVRGSDEGFTVLNVPAENPVIRDKVAYGLAVDIGTTTIAFALVDIESGKVVFSHGLLNSQRAFGADVISRIKAADEGGLDNLNCLVLDDICKGISYICKESTVSTDAIQVMAVAGNTTMLHILLGVSCRSLGQYPFTPEFIEMQRRSFESIFNNKTLNCEVLLLPGISAYVGADICAGILHGCRLENDFVLVDLGTNGEIARFSKGCVTATATAAGPAFEAGNISCGTGSITGAISKAVFRPERQAFEYELIGQEEAGNGVKPLGLCGSGVLDVAAQLVLHGFIDEAGSLDEDFVIAPGINFTQKDVREIQLAKSAVRAGIEVLLAEQSLSYADVNKVYLSGGFGHNLNFESALILGIFPEEWWDKLESIGNSSLAGCIRVLAEPDAMDEIIAISASAKVINLSGHPKFNDLFMEHMMFEK